MFQFEYVVVFILLFEYVMYEPLCWLIWEYSHVDVWKVPELFD